MSECPLEAMRSELHDPPGFSRAAFAREEARLDEVCAAVDSYISKREAAIREYDAETLRLKQELMQTPGHRARSEIEERVRERAPFDPGLRMPAVEHPGEPYLAGLGIRDENPRIGSKFYLLGKQGIAGENSRQIVVDWRQAAISKLYYLYEEGEEYEERIGDFDRTGLISSRIQYEIRKRVLVRLGRNGTFLSAEPEAGGGAGSSISRKESAGDFALTDIIPLISREQFEHITSRYDGCFYLTGGAGSGKTTVALHRLSYLMYNHPDEFRPERCLVVMFNRALRDYVRDTSRDLLTPRMPVETFHSWAEGALRQLGIRAKFQAGSARVSRLKKSAGIHRALLAHVDGKESLGSPLADLGRFFCDRDILVDQLGSDPALQALDAQGQALSEGGTELTFDDAGILARLAQLFRPGQEIPGLAGWYDHVIVDEAQDLSLVELQALYHAASGRRSLTVCADAKQKILDFVDDKCFGDFHADLKRQGLSLGNLGISYRSTRPIMELAGKVSGKPVGEVKSDGPEPRFHAHISEQTALERLRASLQALARQEPNSLTAVVCRYKKESEMVFRAIRGVPGARTILSFKPGIVVTNVHQIKGLEFSNVILWNPTGRSYPQTRIGRNLLYVAITRASKRLAVFHHEPLSALLRP